MATGVLTVATGLLFFITPLHGQTQSIKSDVRTLVKSVREVITNAKEGSSLEAIFQDLDNLQNVTLNLISRLPTSEISECETQTVIKLAAAGVGIHEVMGALLAEGEMEILSRRIGLALSFDDQVAQLLEDKVSRSSDVGPELYAMIFGINTTANIIKTADAAIREKLTLVKDVKRSRRDVARQLARGFDVINHVGWWRDTTGWHTFHVGPFRPPIPSHRPSHVQRRSPQWSGSLTGSGGTGSGNVNGNLGWSNPNGGFSGGVGGGVAWGPGGVQQA
ncbi:hypothetical protein C0Q70_02690 [Pomacea canaliculata]|uniref:Uncharacterized protein n=1 Tax=Pomacea canaliculata TaxID=400727 RepID=A0A2T7PQT6_POMCA|nr:uncharacterized protein LOC112558084 [Pomacea canaliculata]PVD35727.1 hypothetical protein C0Q70_02690 [Pomacea canaliculata]